MSKQKAIDLILDSLIRNKACQDLSEVGCTYHWEISEFRRDEILAELEVPKVKKESQEVKCLLCERIVGCDCYDHC